MDDQDHTSNSFIKLDVSYCFLDGQQEKWLSNGKERGCMWLVLAKLDKRKGNNWH